MREVVVHNSNEWMEPVLARHLGSVAAPDELWERVRCPEPRSQRHTSQRLVWALATAVLIVLSTWGLRQRAGAGGNLEFQSGDAAQIRAWVKDRTGLDIPLPAETAPSIRLVGAHVDTETLRVEILYQTGGHDTRLLVSRSAPTMAGAGSHQFLSNASWVMRGQMYTLASTPADSQAACLLCHVRDL